MKSIKRIVMLLCIACIVIPSCRKYDKTAEEPASSKSMNEMNVDPGFRWETTRLVDITLSGPRTGVVYIKESGGESCYHKGLLTGGQPYTTKITVSSYVREVRLSLNGFTCTVPITAGSVQFNFD